MSLFHRRFGKASVKEALDNLPSGVCFFNSNGILVLCNRQMHALAFALTERDLQTVSELRSVLLALPKGSTATRDGDVFLLPDQSTWCFTEQEIHDQDGVPYTQFVAAEVTDLYRTTKELAQKNSELREITANMERINQNIVAIMREEEILAMKMRIHGEVGSSIVRTRQFLMNGCRAEQRSELIHGWRKTVQQLAGEIGQDDNTDSYRELQKTAGAIGARIVLTGSLPKEAFATNLLVAAMRECLTNAIRHACGSELYVTITCDNESDVTAEITNNGASPVGKITEGVGLGALRKRIEKAGGVMDVQSQPTFSLTLTIPLKGSEIL